MQNTTKTSTIRITGMHCPSCDILVRTKLEGKSSITKVVPNQKDKTLAITHTEPLSIDEINSVLCEYGYKVSNLSEVLDDRQFSIQRNLKEAFIYAVIIGGIYYIVKDLKVIPDIMTNPTSGAGGAFVLGLVASVSTCMATTGALLAGYTHLVKDKSQVAKQTILFITGRLVSYAFFGFLIGLFGGIFTSLASFEGVINIFVAAILVAVALDMLKILSLATIIDLIPGMKSMKNGITQRSSSKSSVAGAFLLGVSTYFLPCGFSLSTQAYAISIANPVMSSLIMTAFAAGTIPALFALGFLSKLRNTKIYTHINKVVGIIVLFVGISYIANTMTLYGVSVNFQDSATPTDSAAVPIKDGKQIVQMTATSSGYSPNSFVIKKGIPVRWEIDGKEIFGCQGAIKSPKVGVKITYLKPGENIIEFTPTETGVIQFSCSMGMFSGKFTVI